MKMQLRKLNILIALLAVGGLALCSGCQRTQRASPLVTEYDKADGLAEVDFWHGLAGQPIVTNNDAFHGLIELANQTDPNDSYETRVAWLKDHDLLDKHFNEPADQAVTRGTVAQILCGILEIPGGLTMRIIGPHPRYALRELIYLKIMQTGTPQQGLSGIQFVGTISNAQDFDGRVP